MAQVPATILEALRRELEPEFGPISINQARRWIEAGYIDASALRYDWLSIRSDLAPPEPEPGGCQMPVLFEDPEVVVFNKPSGLPSAVQAGQRRGTAVHHALAHNSRLELLHRLDTGTSGCLAFARGHESFTRLREEWKQGGVRKFYRARLSQVPAWRLPLQIQKPLGHHPKAQSRMVVIERENQPIRGKPIAARTTLLGMRSEREIEIELHTGVMHQIRAHLASLGAPLEGDLIYGGAESSRLWLLAWKLELPLASGKRVTIEADW